MNVLNSYRLVKSCGVSLGIPTEANSMQPDNLDEIFQPIA